MLKRRSLAANLDDTLHVAPLRPNQPASNLKFLVVINLNVKSTRVFDVVILSILLIVVMLRFVALILVRLSLLLLLLVLSPHILIRELTHVHRRETLLISIRISWLLIVECLLRDLNVFLVSLYIAWVTLLT